MIDQATIDKIMAATDIVEVVSDFVSLLGVRYLVADESTARKIVSLAHDASPLRACGITTVGVINSSGRLLLIRSSCAEADLETDTLMNISSSRMRDIIITDDDWFFRGLTDTADALLDAVSRRCNSVVVTGTPLKLSGITISPSVKEAIVTSYSELLFIGLKLSPTV